MALSSGISGKEGCFRSYAPLEPDHREFALNQYRNTLMPPLSSHVFVHDPLPHWPNNRRLNRMREALDETHGRGATSSAALGPPVQLPVVKYLYE